MDTAYALYIIKIRKKSFFFLFALVLYFYSKKNVDQSEYNTINEIK